MNAKLQAEKLWENLKRLGPRRLAVLGLVGAAVMLVTGLGGWYLSRPTMDVLYAGLEKSDVNRIGSALRELSIPFDLSADGNTVLVNAGQTAQARMLLAEKGLPHGANQGYELFDKMGSLGITSFMQDVTRVRAFEGELARTIQSMSGVKAARVHIVLPDEGSFRRERKPPSAAVVIRTQSADEASLAQSIRHLVAAAIPGMSVNEVTVLDADGVLLASGADQADEAPGKMLTLEKTISRQLQDNISRTLAPYLGAKNFQVSVAARVNTDKKQTSETIYNPDQRVERSVRVTKENQTSQNSTTQAPTTVEQNLPQAKPKTTGEDGKQSNEENQKREETTNYEVSSKSVTTVSGGFAVETVSVAVLINRGSVTATLGDKPPAEVVDRRLAEIEQLVVSAAGLRKDRGDIIKVSAVDFAESEKDLPPVPGPSIVDSLVKQSGTLINAAAIVIVAILLIWFGLRPATKALLATPEALPTAEPTLMIAQQPGAAGEPAQLQAPASDALVLADGSPESLIADLTNRPRRSPQKRLEQIVEYDEVQAAAILKQWMQLERA